MDPLNKDDTEYVREQTSTGVINTHPVLANEEKEERNQQSLQIIAEVLNKYKFT